MARAPALKLALLLALVLVLHLASLEWLGRRSDAIARLHPMAPPMFTRLLKPATPPPVVVQAPGPQPRPRSRALVAPPPRPKASEPKPVEVAKPEPPPPEPVAEPVVPTEAPVEVAAAPEPAASAPAVAASAPVGVASAPEVVASAPAAAASAPAAVASAPEVVASAPAEKPAQDLSSWPTDTRLTYDMGGQYRGGPLFGDARVYWQRQGDQYQVRLDAAVKIFGRVAISQTLTSQGEVTPQGLLPRAYEEYRPGKHRGAQFGERVLALENGKTAPRPDGLQDTASQFVELGHRFATGRERLEVGASVTFWMARPGGVDQWTYDVVEKVIVQTPTMGDVEAFHLKPRPIVNTRGNITAEMWFAPSLQYLPVRIKVLMGETDFLDLRVEKIEQR